ncbi:MAG: hypothetical protein COU31_02660 [Candidatus Magasanikbacteria bacterium CG10_big_fil_rev_8_21_14_0_10_40_10]|uniref:Dephospho-CoA kinase n=1 Tax=Candidatus Magasanikbacteria bacterium CG10_big_fil_rev_8_21_14_0_10_40_10 TaxID=1974648 RepID=A0A2M6W3T2_9BACT|nr:MAG: hypothetical protein COU31_02660 [Candidatus Magasanikbacteria bacterium CG10_big_fil_rev_8_21_14_0_10_40_10]
MDKKIIIGLVGEISAGKTTVTEYLSQKYQAQTFRFSDMLRDILTRLYLPIDRANLQTISTALRSAFGDDVMSRVLADDVSKADNEMIITEGIRRPSDVAYLKKLDNFYIIALKTDIKIRYNRLSQRQENADDQKISYEQFLEQSRQEPEQKIQEMIAKADFSANNNDSKEQLFTQIDEIVKKIKAL